MTEAAPLDDRGRFTVARRYRERLGRKVIQIWTPHGLLLRPLDGLRTARGRVSVDADREALAEVEGELGERRGGR